MKQRLVLLSVLIYCYIGSRAQFYDKTWLVGSSTMVTLTFDSSAPDTASFCDDTAFSIVLASSNISDTDGNLLFYSGGLQMANKLGKIMENGDTLTDLLFYNYFGNGFTERQTNIILPKSGNLFYLFYYSESDSLFASQTIQQPDRLYYAVIDMGANGGLGKVISKRNIAYNGLFGDMRLTACRHANGRDWWLVHQGYENDEYFIYLVTPDSVYSPLIQHIGPFSFQADNTGGQSVFSPDASKFATATTISPLVIMNFDRCTGVFSNPDSVYIPIDTFYYNDTQSVIPTLSGAVATCFSESGRFLYIDNDMDIFQYDTWAANVMASATRIGRWDSIGTQSGFYGFDQMYLLPNGQIIIDDAQGGGNAFHLIDSPDVQGAACHFIFNGLPLNTLSAAALPNMINYRLGALAGSGCDTLGINTVTSAAAEMFKFMPVPATEYLKLAYQATSDFTVRIYAVTGQKMTELNIQGGRSGTYVNIDAFTTGIYYYEIIRDNTTLKRGNLSIIKY